MISRKQARPAIISEPDYIACTAGDCAARADRAGDSPVLARRFNLRRLESTTPLADFSHRRPREVLAVVAASSVASLAANVAEPTMTGRGDRRVAAGFAYLRERRWMRCASPDDGVSHAHWPELTRACLADSSGACGGECAETV